MLSELVSIISGPSILGLVDVCLCFWLLHGIILLCHSPLAYNSVVRHLIGRLHPIYSCCIAVPAYDELTAIVSANALHEAINRICQQASLLRSAVRFLSSASTFSSCLSSGAFGALASWICAFSTNCTSVALSHETLFRILSSWTVIILDNTIFILNGPNSVESLR